MIDPRKMIGGVAAVALFCVVAASPTRAQFGGGDTDMMTTFAPMLEMMKAKMGKRRFARLMQTVGPVMSQMMERDSGGFGGLMSGAVGSSFGGGDVVGAIGGSQMIGMLPQMISLIEMDRPRRKRRHR